MATKTWDSGDGAYDTGFGGGQPASNDTVIYPASNTQAVTSQHTDENAVDCDLIWWQQGYDANIGSSGNELYTSADKLIFEGGGQLWFKAGDTVCDLTIIKARPATSAITSVNLNGTGTTDYTDVRIQRGNVAIGASLSTMTSLWIGRDTIVSIAAGTTITDYRQSGGSVTCHSTLTNAEIQGGTFNLDTVVTGTAFDVRGGLVNILFGGTHPLINVYDGMLDLTQSGSLKTVTTLNMWGGDYKTNALVTFTNPVNDYR
jgi:hypothetical protein